MAFGEKKIPLKDIELKAPPEQVELLHVEPEEVKREQNMG